MRNGPEQVPKSCFSLQRVHAVIWPTPATVSTFSLSTFMISWRVPYVHLNKDLKNGRSRDNKWQHVQGQHQPTMQLIHYSSIQKYPRWKIEMLKLLWGYISRSISRFYFARQKIGLLYSITIHGERLIKNQLRALQEQE